jgi:hypothetical protein
LRRGRRKKWSVLRSVCQKGRKERKKTLSSVLIWFFYDFYFYHFVNDFFNNVKGEVLKYDIM